MIKEFDSLVNDLQMDNAISHSDNNLNKASTVNKEKVTNFLFDKSYFILKILKTSIERLKKIRRKKFSERIRVGDVRNA